MAGRADWGVPSQTLTQPPFANPNDPAIIIFPDPIPPELVAFFAPDIVSGVIIFRNNSTDYAYIANVSPLSRMYIGVVRLGVVRQNAFFGSAFPNNSDFSQIGPTTFALNRVPPFMAMETGAAFFLNNTNLLQVGAGSDIELGGTLAVQSGANLNVQSGGNLNVENGGDIEVESGGDINIQSGGDVVALSGGRVQIASGGELELNLGSDFNIDGVSASRGLVRYFSSGVTTAALAAATVVLSSGALTWRDDRAYEVIIGGLLETSLSTVRAHLVLSHTVGGSTDIVDFGWFGPQVGTQPLNYLGRNVVKNISGADIAATALALTATPSAGTIKLIANTGSSPTYRFYVEIRDIGAAGNYPNATAL